MGNCLSSCAKSSSEALHNNDGKIEQLVPSKANTVIIAQPATCSPIKIFASSANGNDITVLVQKELAALQAQIKHSQAVLESLGSASQGNGRKRVCAFVNRTTQTLGQENQPRSLECIVTKDDDVGKDWKRFELASSCPAIVTNVSIAVQTDNNQQVGLTEVDVRVDSDFGHEQDCFLPPISPHDLANTHHTRPLHKVSSGGTVGFEPRTLDLDLDIYRSCRKLSVLPEEEVCDAPSSPHLMLLSATQQAHSFESYLHPNNNTGCSGPVRQLSDPTPANSNSPPPRASTRRPLQIQTPQTQYFRFPETSSFETDSGLESKPTRSGSRSSPICDIDERITSPTYGILQDTVSQLVTFSPILTVQNLEVPPLKFINSPETSPYKTPPEGFSNLQTPDYCSTPHSELYIDVRKKSIESVSESLSFQTLSDSSPGNVNNPTSSPIGSLSPVKRSSLTDDGSTMVTDLNVPSKLVVKPLHSMLSILMDSKLKSNTEGESLTRAPSRRRLTRSLMRVSSQTPLELVSVREPLPVQPDSTSSSVETVIRTSELHEKPHSNQNKVDSLEDPPVPDIMQNECSMGSKDPANLKRSLSETSASSNFSTQSFPSLSDNVLRQLGLWLEEKKSVSCDSEPQTEKDIEDKFTSLLLAFQTDKLTLSSRLELQNRLRDQAENNLNVEIQQLQLAVTHLLSNKSEELSDIQSQINTLSKAAMRVSSAAEMYGAVQQESRLSRAVDIILSHVENLKLAYHKEKTEHVETKKVLSENKSIANLPVHKARCRRRATIAVGVAQLGTNVSSHDNNSIISSTSLVDARAGTAFAVRSRFQRQPQLSRERSNSVDNFQGIDKQVIIPTEDVSDQISHMLRITSTEKKIVGSCTHEECNCDQHTDSDIGDESDISFQEEPSYNHLVLKSYQRYQSRFSDHWNTILNSTDELLLHARYGIAGILIVAAIAIFCSMLYL